MFHKISGYIVSRIYRLGSNLASNIFADHVHGEQIADGSQIGILLQFAQVSEGHLLTQLLQPPLGDLAITANEFRIALKDRLRKKFVTRNFYPKLPFKTKNEIEKID